MTTSTTVTDPGDPACRCLPAADVARLAFEGRAVPECQIHRRPGLAERRPETPLTHADEALADALRASINRGPKHV